MGSITLPFSGQSLTRLLLASMLTACAAFSSDLPAQSPEGPRTSPIEFSVPAGSLQRALAILAEQAGLSDVRDAGLAAGRTSPGVQGTLSLDRALQRVLGDSGLAYEVTGGSLYLSPADETAVALTPIQVDGTLVGTRIGETAAESAASVRIFSGRELNESPDTLAVRDLFERTANVVDFGQGNFAPAIRGQDATGAASGGLAFIAGTRPRATLTVDGRPLSTFGFVGGPTGLWDVEQVEVYRGPQTTLQGRNSIAGAIVVDTNDPTFYWDARAQAAIGSEDRHRVSALLSGPVVDEALAFRLSVDRFGGDSFVDFTGPQAISDVEKAESLTVRGKLLFAPASAPDFTAQFTVAHRDSRRPQAQLAEPPFDERRRETSQTQFNIEVTDLVLDLDYTMDRYWHVSNTSSWSDILFDRKDAPARGQFRLEGPQFTNETLLNLDNPAAGLKGVLGVYFFAEDRDDSGFIGTPLVFGFDDETFTSSVFGELEWRLAKGLRATVGARYEREDRERQGTAFGITTDLDETFDAFLPKFGLEYDAAHHTTVGALVARGFNAGGGSVSFGASDPSGNPSPDPALGPRSFVFDSEFVWNYELFSRTQLMGDRLLLTANAFYSDYEDQQRVEQLDFPGGFTDTIITNTPESRSIGAEIGLEYYPSPRFDAYADVGLLDTEIERSGDARLEGNELARSPNFTASAGINLRPLSSVRLGLDARYVGEYFSTDINNPLAEAGDYFLANVSANWQPTEHWRVFAAVTNLFDSDAEQRLFSFPATAPPSLANVVEPRVIWVGMEVGL